MIRSRLNQRNLTAIIRPTSSQIANIYIPTSCRNILRVSNIPIFAPLSHAKYNVVLSRYYHDNQKDRSYTTIKYNNNFDEEKEKQFDLKVTNVCAYTGMLVGGSLGYTIGLTASEGIIFGFLFAGPLCSILGGGNGYLLGLFYSLPIRFVARILRNISKYLTIK